MSNITYAIVFNGEILEGFQPISVKAHMAKLLKADADKMAVLFSGKQIVIKRTADKTEAAKYGSALKKVGADIKVKVIKGETAAAKPAATPVETPVETPAAKKASAPTNAAQPKATPAAPDTSNLSLAANEGNLVEPAPPPPAPELDLSGISVAENDGAPLVEPTEWQPADIDVSNISVAENDGSNLVEAEAKEVPVIEVPDFGLDEPGAILETIQEEKELLNPNTMGITLAMPGSDLLEPEEKDQGPPPKAPDTSGINLVPNFDVG